MLYGWKVNSMLTNCHAACAHLTITVSEIERDIGRKSSFFHTPLYSTPQLGGFLSEYRHRVWYGKTRMAWLPDGEKISIHFGATHERVRHTHTQTHRQTPHAGIYRAYAYASRGKNHPILMKFCIQQQILNWTNVTLRLFQMKKVALDRLRVRQNVFLVN